MVKVVIAAVGSFSCTLGLPFASVDVTIQPTKTSPSAVLSAALMVTVSPGFAVSALLSCTVPLTTVTVYSCFGTAVMVTSRSGILMVSGSFLDCESVSPMSSLFQHRNC